MLIVFSAYAIFGITVNNPFIAAILTVVGYSINDTIVIFDRVRENLRYMKKGGTAEILDLSINQTLSRSIMTSLTTFIVMVPLFIMTSSAIREFTLPLMIGVATGCMSSIFICSPLYFEMATRGKDAEKHEREMARAKRKQKQQEERLQREIKPEALEAGKVVYGPDEPEQENEEKNTADKREESKTDFLDGVGDNNTGHVYTGR